MDYIVREKDGKMVYSEAAIVEQPENLGLISQPIRMKLLLALSKQPMYPAELAKKLAMHEQKVYYHIKQMQNAGLIEVAERKDIRGTTAKKFRAKCLNFAVCLSKKWGNLKTLIGQGESTKAGSFLAPFITDGTYNSSIIVGSPDPHGPYKVRARDGHYAIDLAMHLGKYGELSERFNTKLDVDIGKEDYQESMIVVGGPVANLVTSKINEFLPARFSNTRPWGIVTKYDKYTEESIGVISSIPNPFNKEKQVLFLAGVSSGGTKSAVLALTRYTELILGNYSGGSWYRVVHGFDMDGDGKIDAIEIKE
ncbi:helix-turn-helix domain-containing protein [Candidatus Woesearchaeota archaeon]|nr:helix-turn-helix domain-containing protein [Candidatus Woesearchaeota archaeon]